MNATKKREYKTKCRNVIEKLQSNSSRLIADFKKINEIFSYYETYKKSIHKNMGNKDILTKTDHLMDNHKIAAAFFCSFLKAKPLKYQSDKSNVPPNSLELWANEQGAFLFGLQIVQDFWADKYETGASAEEQEIYQKLIRLPKPDHDNYIHWFIKLVIDGAEKYFDFETKEYHEKMIFFIAHIYFMVDSYSYQFHRAELYKQYIPNS